MNWLAALLSSLFGRPHPGPDGIPLKGLPSLRDMIAEVVAGPGATKPQTASGDDPPPPPGEPPAEPDPAASSEAPADDVPSAKALLGRGSREGRGAAAARERRVAAIRPPDDAGRGETGALRYWDAMLADDGSPDDPAATPVPQDAAQPVAVADWLSAWLEDTGVRLPAGALAADLAGGGASGLEGEGVGDAPALIDGQFSASPGPGALVGKDGRPLRAGERLELRDYQEPGKVARDEAALARTPAGGLPPDAAAYHALLHATYDRHKAYLLQRLADEHLFAYARFAWRVGAARPGGTRSLVSPADVAKNVEIFHAVFMRLSRLMGTIYDYEPAPLATVETAPGETVSSKVPAMPAGFIGWYDLDADVVYVAQRLLGGSVADLCDTIAHEQMHAFHRAMIVKLRQGELSGAKRSLALYWDAELDRWKQRCDGLGLGYHAHDVGRAVGYAVKGLLRPEAMGP